jgi:hypothetical protein
MAKYFTDARRKQILQSPWTRPSKLTRESTLVRIGSNSRVFLSTVIDLMSGLPDPTTMFRRSTGGHPTLVTKRQRAARALFAAVAKANEAVLVGSLDHQIDQSIEPHYFDLPRALGGEINSIDTDLAECAENPRWHAQFDAYTSKPWFNVRVDAAWLVGWLFPEPIESATEGHFPPKHQQVRALLKERLGGVPDRTEMGDRALLREVKNNWKAKFPARLTTQFAAQPREKNNSQNRLANLAGLANADQHDRL